MRELNFSNGTVVTPAWLDSMQEVKSGLAVNVRLEKQSSTSVRVTAANDGNGQASLVIGGKMRWNTATEVLTLSGTAGTYSIFAIVDEENPVEVGNDPGTRTFSLEQNSGTPTATNRKIGEVDWSGTAITAVRNYVGPAPTHNPVFTGSPTLETDVSSSAAGDELVTAEWVRAYVASLNIYSTGDVKIWTGSTLPTGWLWCDGSAVARVGTYAPLFAIIGTAFGAGDGSTTFNLPDLRGRVPFGLDTMDNSVGTGGGAAGRQSGVTATRGAAGGLNRELIDLSYIPPHTHAGSISGGDHAHNAQQGEHVHSTYVVFSGNFYWGAQSYPNYGAYGPVGTGSGQNRASAEHSHYVEGNVGVSFANTFNSGGVQWVAGWHATNTGISIHSASHSHTFTGGAINSYPGQANFYKMPPYQFFGYIIKV